MHSSYRPLILTLLLATTPLAVGALLYGCAKDDSSSSSSARVYGTTGSTGDYADWTVDGDSLSAVWRVTDSLGAIDRTLNIEATCGAADATFGYKTCAITTASCTDGAQACASDSAPLAGFTFYAFEVPGLALMVKGEGADEQLHVGLLKDTSCGSIAGDYTYMMTGILKQDLFGIYRTDADFNSVTHADFGFNNGGTVSTTPSVSYTTGGGSGNGVETITGSGCTDGVRTRVVSGAATVRLAASSTGAFIVDLPSGQGGLVAFKTSNAATLADFAGKSFGGISFPDNGSEQLLSVTTGSSTGSAVPLSSIAVLSGGTTNTDSTPDLAFKPVTTTSWEAVSPSYPIFTSSVSAYTDSANTLKDTYATPSAIPGLFVLDGTSQNGSDTGRVFAIAMKSNNKVLMFGSSYNHREVSTGTYNLANSGAFIAFEK